MSPETDHTIAVFAQIVASYSEVARCEMDNKSGGPCARPVRWLLDLHGCERRKMCGQHLRAWERAAVETSTGRCAHCGHQFADIADAYTATPL